MPKLWLRGLTSPPPRASTPAAFCGAGSHAGSSFVPRWGLFKTSSGGKPRPVTPPFSQIRDKCEASDDLSHAGATSVPHRLLHLLSDS